MDWKKGAPCANPATSPGHSLWNVACGHWAKRAPEGQ